ncbi:MAG: SCP2 sterol-binding domain-containing protein [Pseudomonadota bacterium]
MAIKRFTLPKPLTLPLGLVPPSLHSRMMVLALNRIFAALIRAGELDFLANKIVCIKLRDAGVALRARLLIDSFEVCNESLPADVTISGDVYDFLLLATRKEDSDTLFFQRRLCIEGDTALGLELKNRLDALELEDLRLAAPVQRLFKQANGLADRLLG